MNDIDIIKNVQKWREDDFVMLYDKYIKKVYDFIFYKVWDKSTAEDLTSDTFLKAYKNIMKFDITRWTKPSTWLYTIAHNLVIDYYRVNSNEVEYDWIEDIWKDENILENTDNAHKLNQILEFLETFDNDKKEIFIMRIWDQLSYAEIAEITWKSETNAKVIFSRIMKQMVDKFWIWILLIFTI